MKKLESLDLSRNHISGEIPTSFLSLNFLAALNLSHNYLSGKTPVGTQFQTFNASAFMGNPGLCGPPLTPNCSGTVPSPADDNKKHDTDGTQFQTFNASAFMGNPGLCGPPLTPNCSGTVPSPADDNKKHDTDGLIGLGFFISTVLGFVSGFWIVCGSLLLKSSWRYAYFKYLDDSRDWIYVKTAVYKAKMQRRLQR